MTKNTVYRLLITNVLLLVSAVFIILGAINYLTLRNILKETNEQQNKLIFDDIKSVIDYQNVSLNVVEDLIISQLQLLSYNIANKVVTDGLNPEKVNLDRIKDDLGAMAPYIDIYVISKQGIVVNTTFSRDKGLNLFDFGKEHKAFLQSVWDENVFKTAGFTIESVSGRPRIYTYQPTPGGKYILELGISSPGAEKLVKFINQRLFEISSKKDGHIQSAEILTVVDTTIYSLGRKINFSDKDYILEVFRSKQLFNYETHSDSGWHRYTYQYIANQESGLYKHFVIRVVENIEHEKALLTNQGIRMVLTFLVTLALIGTFIYFNSMHLVKLVDKMIAAASKISGGDYSHRLEIKSPLEFATLANKFNEMVQRIQEYHEHLENRVLERTSKLLRQKEELERTSNQLAVKNRQMEQINSIINTLNSEVNYLQMFTMLLKKLNQLDGVDKLAFLDTNNPEKRLETKATLGYQESEVPYKNLSWIEFYKNIHAIGAETEEYVLMMQADVPNTYKRIVLLLGRTTEANAMVVLESVGSQGISHENAELISQLRDYLLAAYIRSKLMLSLEKTLDDLNSTQEQLIQQEKLASLGQLTAGIAHEIRNPLNFITNFTQLSVELAQSLLQDIAKNDFSPTYLTEDLETISSNLVKILKHSHRAEAIIKEMLSHSGSSDSHFERVNVVQLIKDYTQLAYLGFRNEHPEFIANVIYHSASDEIFNHIQPQQFSRVIINLITNACYSMQQKLNTITNYMPEINISIEKNEKNLTFVFKDNGEGIPDEIRNQIFQPFFTTKPAGKGTGLGLSLSYDIITKTHKGSIEIKSILNDGVEFAISLPLANSKSI